jgi:hypothetical protein
MPQICGKTEQRRVREGGVSRKKSAGSAWRGLPEVLAAILRKGGANGDATGCEVAEEGRAEGRAAIGGGMGSGQGVDRGCRPQADMDARIGAPARRRN